MTKISQNNKRVAFFAGSFNPFTIGHKSIVDRALSIFDEVVIGIGINPDKPQSVSADQRVESIRRVYGQNEKVSVVSYSGLTVEKAQECGARFLLRGVRTATDFEYEQKLAQANRELAGVETVLLFTLPELGHVSSTLVRNLQEQGGDTSAYLPQIK